MDADRARAIAQGTDSSRPSMIYLIAWLEPSGTVTWTVTARAAGGGRQRIRTLGRGAALPPRGERPPRDAVEVLEAAVRSFSTGG